MATRQAGVEIKTTAPFSMLSKEELVGWLWVNKGKGDVVQSGMDLLKGLKEPITGQCLINMSASLNQVLRTLIINESMKPVEMPSVWVAVAECFDKGLCGLEPNAAKARKYHEFAAGGFLELGHHYEYKYRPEKKGLAFACYQKAAEQAPDESDYYYQAIYEVAMCHEYGYGTKQDEKKAARLYKEAADQGHLAACELQVGRFFEYSTGGCAKNMTKAKKYYELCKDNDKALPLHRAEAQCELALCLLKDEGQNKEAAIKQLEAAIQALEAIEPSKRNYGLLARAQLTLGWWYESAQSKAHDDDAAKEAFRLYQAAAMEHNAGAVFNLGACYELPFGGVDADKEKALGLYRKFVDMEGSGDDPALKLEAKARIKKLEAKKQRPSCPPRPRRRRQNDDDADDYD